MDLTKMLRLNHSNISSLAHYVILIAIIIFAVLIRLWGIHYGLPHTECYPDEKQLILKAINYGRGDLNPHDFRYPSLYSYLLYILYGFYYVIGRILSSSSSKIDFMVGFITNPTTYFLIDRIFSMVFGILTIVMIYKIAKKIYDKTTALISTLFMSFAYLHVIYSHFGVTDIPMTFFLMLALYSMIMVHEEPIVKNYFLAGILAGIATSTKYNALLLFIPMIIIHMLNFEHRNQIAQYLDRRIVLFFIAMGIGFLIGTPYSLLDSKTFINDFFFNIDHLNRGHGIIFGRGWWYHLKMTLFYGIGPAMLTSAIIGIIYIFIKNPKKGAILFSFPISYYLVAGKGYTVFTRYMIPTVPFLCIASAIMVCEGTDALCERLKPYNMRSILIVLFSLLILINPFKNIIDFDRIISKKDTRILASQWITNNIKEDSVICMIGSKWGKVELPKSIDDWKKEYEEAVAGGGRGRVLNKVINNMERKKQKGYRIIEFQEISGKKEANPDFILLEQSPLYYYSKIPDSVIDLLRKNYEMIEFFKSIDGNGKDIIYDQQNAFYVPYYNFKGVKRPGPNIYIYKLRVN